MGVVSARVLESQDLGPYLHYFSVGVFSPNDLRLSQLCCDLEVDAHFCGLVVRVVGLCER